MKSNNEMNKVTETYQQVCSIKQTSRMFRISEQKVRKIIIDAGIYENGTSIEVSRLTEKGLSTKQIAERMGVSLSTVSANMPYKKGMYNLSEPSENAIRIRRSREKKKLEASN